MPDPRIQEFARAAIEAAGGGATLARECGVTRYAVQLWKATGIPARHIGRVSSLTGIPPHELRPDLWEAPAEATA